MTVVEKSVQAHKGGSFLIERHNANDILIPEAFNEELKLIGNTAQQFVERDIKPVFDQLESLDLSDESAREQAQETFDTVRSNVEAAYANVSDAAQAGWEELEVAFDNAGDAISSGAENAQEALDALIENLRADTTAE